MKIVIYTDDDDKYQSYKEVNIYQKNKHDIIIEYDLNDKIIDKIYICEFFNICYIYYSYCLLLKNIQYEYMHNIYDTKKIYLEPQSYIYYNYNHLKKIYDPNKLPYNIFFVYNYIVHYISNYFIAKHMSKIYIIGHFFYDGRIQRINLFKNHNRDRLYIIENYIINY